MPTTYSERQTKKNRWIWVLFLGALLLLALTVILGKFDTTTELVPAHDRIDQLCIAIPFVCAVIVGGVSAYLTSSLTIYQRIVLPLVLMCVVGGCTFIVGLDIASIIEGRIDFPVGKTQTRQVLIAISRAYRTTGKRESQYIQTTPIWSSLEITPEDFAFMQSHRRSDDVGQDPNEIASRGYFCAKVTIEQTSTAMRILHAGSQKLPEGTVIVCPVRRSGS